MEKVDVLCIFMFNFGKIGLLLGIILVDVLDVFYKVV